jgi:hypothetical protein
MAYFDYVYGARRKGGSGATLHPNCNAPVAVKLQIYDGTARYENKLTRHERPDLMTQRQSPIIIFDAQLNRLKHARLALEHGHPLWDHHSHGRDAGWAFSWIIPGDAALLVQTRMAPVLAPGAVKQ